jgi:demethylmenaquinone methyltransferase/2-methoxy-6-polyprenyl-1,4-benzoquinol methylase
MSNDLSSFNSPREKASYVNAMFARIADHYDRMNRLMSLGRDQAWRHRAIQLTAVPPGGRLLDVAVGTGDLALYCQEQDPSVHVTGLDFTLPMMRVGREKERMRRHQAGGNGTGPLLGWTGGDALHLPFPDETFDAVVSGFMMRNVTDIVCALEEQRRVVRPGGRVVCLETTRPTLPLWRELYAWIFGQMMPVITGLLSGQPDAYRYLPASVNQFVGASQLKGLMAAAGLRGVGYQTMMLGTVAIHVGVR